MRRLCTLLLLLVAVAWAAADKQPQLAVTSFDWNGTQARVRVKNVGDAPSAGARVRITAGNQLLGVLESRTTLTPGAEGQLEGPLNGDAPVAGAISLRPTTSLATGQIYAFQTGETSGQLSVEEMLRGRLGVEAVEVPREAHAGEKVDVLVRVANLGEGAVGGPTVVLLENGKEVARERLLRRLGSGSRESVRFTWTPRAEGPVTLGAAFDPPSPALEGDPVAVAEVAVAAARKAELTVEGVSFDAPPRENAACLVTVKVVNRGNAPAYTIPVQLTVGDSVVARKTERGRFEAGSTTLVPVRWVPRGMGNQPLMAGLEGSSQKVSSKVDVLGKPGVNLKVVRLEAPGKVLVGRPAEFTAVITNTGEIPAFSCVVTLKEGGLPVASARSDAYVNPGSEVKVPLRWTPSLPGAGTCIAEVESNGPGQEATMEDNRAEVEFEVTMPRN